MSKASLHFGFSATSIKIWSRPRRLSFCVLRLVDRDYLYFDVQWCDVNLSRFCFQIFFNLLKASLDSQGEDDCEIVPIEPEETQIWKGENESVRSCQHLILQLLLVITAFI